MPKIAFVYIFKYGNYPILYEYCNQLANLNYEVFYLGISDSNENFIDTNNVNVIHFDRDSAASPRSFSELVNDKLATIKPDFVHVFQYRWCCLLPLLSKNKLQWLLDVRTVHVGDKNGHYSRLTFLKNKLTWIESLFYNQSIALTPRIKSLLYPSRKPVPIIPLGASLNKFNPIDRDILRSKTRSSLNLHPEDQVFLYCGTLNPNRKLEKVFEAFAQFYQQEKRVYLLVLGHDKDNDKTIDIYKELCDRLGISKRVHFTGYLSYHHTIQFYCASDIGISFVPNTPHFDLQPPTKLFEYMAAKLIVISTKSSAVRKVLKDNYSGILTDDNSQSLTEAISRAYFLNEVEKENMLKRADIIVSQFDWGHLIKTKLLPVYNRVLHASTF